MTLSIALTAEGTMDNSILRLSIYNISSPDLHTSHRVSFVCCVHLMTEGDLQIPSTGCGRDRFDSLKRLDYVCSVIYV